MAFDLGKKKQFEAVCDNCGETIKPKTQEVNGYVFFKCPECNTEYPICQISERGLELREELRDAYTRYNRLKMLSAPRKNLVQQANKIQQLLKDFQAECTPLAEENKNNETENEEN